MALFGVHSSNPMASHQNTLGGQHTLGVVDNPPAVGRIYRLLSARDHPAKSIEFERHDGVPAVALQDHSLQETFNCTRRGLCSVKSHKKGHRVLRIGERRGGVDVAYKCGGTAGEGQGKGGELRGTAGKGGFRVVEGGGGVVCGGGGGVLGGVWGRDGGGRRFRVGGAAGAGAVCGGVCGSGCFSGGGAGRARPGHGVLVT